MYHTSMNNFRSYYNGYPFKSNVIDEIQAVGEASDETIIAGAHEQIEAILTMKPFDPEEFGFKEKGGIFEKDVEGTRFGLCPNILNNKYGYWQLNITEPDQGWISKGFTELYIPNDLAGRIILTALGIVKRRDLDEEGKGCPDDTDLDGICTMCENNGTCLNKK